MTKQWIRTSAATVRILRSSPHYLFFWELDCVVVVASNRIFTNNLNIHISVFKEEFKCDTK